MDSKELEKKLQECQKQKDEFLAGWQRSKADFLNYKKEEAERTEEFLKYAARELVSGLLPVLDNFREAEKKIPEDRKKDEFLRGLLQIKSQLESFLKSRGVEEIKALGQKFDPELHEAVGEEEGKEPGKVVEEIRKGYTMEGRVIRPSKVKIGK